MMSHDKTVEKEDKHPGKTSVKEGTHPAVNTGEGVAQPLPAKEDQAPKQPADPKA